MMDTEQYEGLPPELIAALMEGSFSEEELAEIAAKIQSGEARRDQAFSVGPQGRQAGSVYVAANPLEHVGNFMQGYAGMKQAKQGAIEQKDARAAEKNRIGMVIDQLRQKPVPLPMDDDTRALTGL